MPFRSKWPSSFLPSALEQHVLVYTVVVPLVVRRHLVRPDHLAGLGLASEDRHRPLVVARPLVGVPGARVTGAVVEEVELGVVGVPAPGRSAATLPLVARPGREAEILALVRRVIGVGFTLDADFLVGAGAVHGPLVLTRVHVPRGDAAADAELPTRDTGDDQVLDHDRDGRHRRTLLVVDGFGAGIRASRVPRFPELLPGLGIEPDQLTLQRADEDLTAWMIRGATIHHVAARNGNRVGRLVRDVLPDHRCAWLREIERVHDVRERGIDVHHVPNDQRTAFVTAERPGRERPRDLEVFHVCRRDLLERAKPLQAVITPRAIPVALGRVQGPCAGPRTLLPGRDGANPDRQAHRQQSGNADSSTSLHKPLAPSRRVTAAIRTSTRPRPALWRACRSYR